MPDPSTLSVNFDEHLESCRMNCAVFGLPRSVAALFSVLRNLMTTTGLARAMREIRHSRRRFCRIWAGLPEPFDADSGRKEFYP